MSPPIPDVSAHDSGNSLTPLYPDKCNTPLTYDGKKNIYQSNAGREPLQCRLGQSRETTFSEGCASLSTAELSRGDSVIRKRDQDLSRFSPGV
jgi:hypothetical protein